MSALLQEVVSKANNLSSEECAELAHELIVSLDDVMDTKHEQVWNAEIERRVNEINAGKAKGRPAEELLAEIRAKYS
jgi:putative addiction module component (TIGR02574 family)